MTRYITEAQIKVMERLSVENRVIIELSFKLTVTPGKLKTIELLIV